MPKLSGRGGGGPLGRDVGRALDDVDADRDSVVVPIVDHDAECVKEYDGDKDIVALCEYNADADDVYDGWIDPVGEFDSFSDMVSNGELDSFGERDSDVVAELDADGVLECLVELVVDTDADAD